MYDECFLNLFFKKYKSVVNLGNYLVELVNIK